MLNQNQVKLVQELSDAGMSQREISRTTRIARETVRGIVNGSRPDYEQEEQSQGRSEEIRLGLFQGEVGRCPKCGAKVYMPCLACQIRRGMNRHTSLGCRLVEVARSGAG